MLIKLSDTCWVAVDQVSTVQVRDGARHVTVTLTDGAKHLYEPDYGESVYTALDRLTSQLNAIDEKNRE